MYISDSDARQIAAAASNIRTGGNPSYSLATDFFPSYPQFGPKGTAPNQTYLVLPVVMQMYCDLAYASLSYNRWHEAWNVAMGWFIAHFLTLYLQSMASAASAAAQVIAAGQSRGLVASKTVGDVSVSYDYNSIAQDLDGWAAWKLTTFGVQLATFAKRIGRGGMYVR